MDISQIDKNLSTIKSFYTYIGNIIDKGHTNDNTTLDNLCGIIKIYYSEISKSDYSSNFIDNTNTFLKGSDADDDDDDYNIFKDHDINYFNSYDNSHDCYNFNTDDESSSTSPENGDLPSYLLESSIKKKNNTEFLDIFMNKEINNDKILLYRDTDKYINRVDHYIKSISIY